MPLFFAGTQHVDRRKCCQIRSTETLSVTDWTVVGRTKLTILVTVDVQYMSRSAHLDLQLVAHESARRAGPSAAGYTCSNRSKAFADQLIVSTVPGTDNTGTGRLYYDVDWCDKCSIGQCAACD